MIYWLARTRDHTSNLDCDTRSNHLLYSEHVLLLDTLLLVYFVILEKYKIFSSVLQYFSVSEFNVNKADMEKNHKSIEIETDRHCYYLIALSYHLKKGYLFVLL